MILIAHGLAFLTMFSLLVNEIWGSPLLMAATAGWLLLVIPYWKPIGLQAISQAGVVVWLVPVLAVLSTVWSQEPAITFRAGSELVLTVFLMACIARTIPPRNFIIILFAALTVISLISVASNNLSLNGTTEELNHTGMFENKNTFSLCTAMLIMTSLIIVTDSRIVTWLRVLAIPIMGLAAVQNMMAHSVGSTLLLAISIFWAGAILSSRLLPAHMRKSYVLFVVVAGVTLIGLGSFIAINFADELLAMVGKDPTLTGRTDLWFYAARFISDNSWLGVGYDAFWVKGHALPEYLWHLEHLESGDGFSFHNIFLELMVEIGLPGLVLGTAAMTVTFLSVVRWMRTDLSNEAIFFFCMVDFLIIMQVQAASMFTPFDSWYAAFCLALIYSRTRGYVPVRATLSVPAHAMVGRGV